MALLKSVFEVVVLGQHSRTDKLHVFGEGNVGTDFGDGASLRSIPHNKVAFMIFGRGLQTLTKPFVAIDSPFDDYFCSFLAENHEIEELIFIKVILCFIFLGSLVFGLNTFLQISVEVNHNCVILLLVKRLTAE
ncbi:MAG: hypothetical protein E6Q39_01520 [Crocinitomicaceae bacterium]|nr:MAG: hypothetical protein E6Q39_01520 [Crocinitomicaceae bacterium]